MAPTPTPRVRPKPRRREPVTAQVRALLRELQGLGSERNRAGMKRYGINVDNAYGVSVTELRRIARRLGRDHDLAAALWKTGKHEARILACLVEEPERVTAAQTEAWVKEFDSWDLCDQVTCSLFDKTKYGWPKARQWSARRQEWTKRAGFSLMAGLASHDERADDASFIALLPLIEQGAFDERNFVKKAVNWALRGIGKRNAKLNAAAIRSAERILKQADARSRKGRAKGARSRNVDAAVRAARWVARDALRELSSEKIRARLSPRAG
ncbi:MAG: DNA alkylation repair protein [Polyangiaceae bacterium]